MRLSYFLLTYILIYGSMNLYFYLRAVSAFSPRPIFKLSMLAALAFMLAAPMLVSLWPVDSNTTVAFMTRFYAHLKSGKSKAHSLQLTQLEFMTLAAQGGGASEQRSITAKRTGQPSPETAHPYYWAPFVLIGD
jgi:hypothetical protein